MSSDQTKKNKKNSRFNLLKVGTTWRDLSSFGNSVIEGLGDGIFELQTKTELSADVGVVSPTSSLQVFD